MLLRVLSCVSKHIITCPAIFQQTQRSGNITQFPALVLAFTSLAYTNRSRYDVDAVLPSTEVNGYLASSETPKSTVFAIPGQVSDHITFLPFGETKFDFLKPAIEECRVRKTPYEIALIRAANTVSTAAHTAVMRAVSHATNERELEAIFLKTCIERGCRNQAYSSIVASGTSAATLHYVRNDQPLSGKLNLLLDAGAELECYASDITRTFPINGRFTQESREIFDIVLEMQRSCIEMLRAGVVWDDVHAHAHKIAIDGLGKLGILQGLTEEIFNARTSVAFFPHGLGHYLGMDTHDTGGHANYQDKDPMFRYLRVRGEVPAGAVITVEPGIYFCRFIVEPYLEDEKHAKYIDREVLERYWEVGGVRIEGKYLTSFPSGLRGGFVLGFQRQCADIVADNVLITEEGYENLTDTPKQADEMERFIMG